MICKDIEIKIKNGQSTIGEKPWCFFGDRGIRFLLIIKDSNFLIDGSLVPSGLSNAFASIRFLRPNSKQAFTIEAPIIDDKVVLTITQDLTDQLDEIGLYTCQVHLFDGDRSSRITIPEFTFEVKELIGEMQDLPPEETSYMYYGRVSAEERGGIELPYTGITESMIKNGAAMNKVYCSTLERTSMGKETTTTAYDYIVVAVPKSKNYTVTMESGISGKVQFDERYAGANGIPIKIDNIDYLLYGVEILSQAEIFIYID